VPTSAHTGDVLPPLSIEIAHVHEASLAKESTSFLKKRSKRLSSLSVCPSQATHTKWQKFFGSFFQKRTLPS
jgi:hypothetical protein